MTDETYSHVDLTPEELRFLLMMRELATNWVELDLTERGRACIDMLVLEGLAERRSEQGAWVNQWRLTPYGQIEADNRTWPSAFA